MFANPRAFGMSTPSFGSLAVPRVRSVDESRGASAAGQVVQPESPQPARRTIPSIGSWACGYYNDLVTTASTHTILDTLKLPVLIVAEAEALVQQPNAGIQHLSEVLDEIEVLTGLRKARIAEDLFDVTRTAYHDWSIGKRVSIDNDRRIRGTLDVLQRASARHGDPELLRGWLVTPVGSRAVAPMDLLKFGSIDEARLLAQSALPMRETALPEWLLTGPINKWSEREQKRRDYVVRESDAIPTPEGDG